VERLHEKHTAGTWSGLKVQENQDSLRAGDQSQELAVVDELLARACQAKQHRSSVTFLLSVWCCFMGDMSNIRGWIIHRLQVFEFEA
jgi:hypothetical protein